MANFNSDRFISIANASAVERLHVRKDTRTGGSNTVFVDTANTLYYELYINGIHLENSDYTVSNNQIDIHHALDPTDEVEIVRFGGNAPLNMPSDPLEKQSTSYTGTTNTVFIVDTSQNTEHEVYINGLHLTANMYTVSGGSLTLTGITPVANDVIEIVEYSGVQFVSSGDIVSNTYFLSELAGVGGGGDVSNTYLQAQGYLTTETGDVSNTYLQATFDPDADVSNTYLQTVLGGGGGSGDVSNTYLNAELANYVSGDNSTKTTQHSNWDNVYGSGFYDSAANTANGSPTGSWYWGIHHEHSNENGYGFQFVVQNAITPDVYVRTQSANNWNSWTEIPTTASFTETLLIKNSAGSTLKTIKSIP